MNPIEMAEAARELAREYPVSVEAALQMIRDYGGVDGARRLLDAWSPRHTSLERQMGPAKGAPLFD
jgi:hypothetical protein